MDLSYTAKQQAFRTEARSWLEENAPSEPLRSFDTPEGFEEHREWEKKLHAGGFAMVPSEACCSCSTGWAFCGAPAAARLFFICSSTDSFIRTLFRIHRGVRGVRC